MTTPSNASVPSNLPTDLLFNAEKFDQVMTGVLLTYTDRLGNVRYTIAGLETKNDELIAELTANYNEVVNNLMPLGKVYPSLDGPLGADAAIESGEIQPGALFFIRAINDSSIADEYKNDGGVATATGKSYMSETGVNEAINDVRDNTLRAFAAGINDANAAFGVIDKNNRLLFGLTPDGDIISPTVNNINKRLDLVKVIAGGINDFDAVYAWIDKNNRMLAGINSSGELLSPTITGFKERLDFIESVTGSQKTMRFCIVYGQSNSTGAVDMSQVWRTTDVWGVYPDGYDGPLDGDAVITNHDNGVYTLSSDRSRLIPLVTTAFGVIDGDGPVHGAFDTTKKHYPQYNYMTLGHGRGSSSIAQLDKPTPAEITAGNASGIAIPTTSVEYMMQAAGQGWDKLSLYRYQDCATPYYRGMWLFNQSIMVCALNGFKLEPDTILWLQGENDGNDTEGYADKLIAFYDQYTADIKTIFSYTGKISMIIEQSNYSSTSVTNEQLKINNHFDLNIEQMKAAEKAVTLSPMRSIYLAAPRYPLTNNIHLYPHAQRAHGEQMGKVYRKVNIENQGWKAFTYDFWWLSGNDLFIKMRPPVAPLQFVIPINAISNEMRTGKPYGFSYSGGDLTLSSVQIVGRELIKVSFPDDPRGKSISYLKDVRVGSLCDSDETTPMFMDRWGNPNNMKNYCCPFIIQM